MVTVTGMTGQDTSFTVTAITQTTPRWYIKDSECYITTGFSSAVVEGVGNDGLEDGFRAPCGHDDDGRDLAFSEYTFSWDLPFPHSDPSSISLDLRDADWTGNYSSPVDITIRYNITYSKYEVKIGGGSYSDLTDDEIWDILPESPPNQEAFQPTEPREFECTNPTETEANPEFSWEQPSWPYGSRSMTVYYKIYRREGKNAYSCVAEDLTSTSWTDDEVTIETTGSWFYYYATAYLASSPESDKSDIASIKGQNSAKPIAEQQEDNSNQSTKQFPVKVKLNIFPNPFNPSTNISYYLPEDNYVQLTLYNIAGQKIAELSNGYKFSGDYSVNFNAQALAGGIYFVHLQAGVHHQTQKILLFK